MIDWSAALDAMRRSLERHGQLTPIVAFADGDRCETLDGFKRLRAARALGWAEVAVTIAAVADGIEAKVRLAELHQHRGLTELEQGWLIRSLYRDDKLSQSEIARRLDRHKSWVCRRLVLVEALDLAVRADVRLGLLAPRAAIALAALPRGNQVPASAVVIRRGPTVPQTERTSFTVPIERYRFLDPGSVASAFWSKGRSKSASSSCLQTRGSGRRRASRSSSTRPHRRSSARSCRCSGFRNRLLDRWAWQPNVQRCRASNPTAYRCRVALSVYAHAVTSDPARISVTAKVSAYYRKFSDIAFAAEVATLIGADEAFAEIVREHALEPDKLTFYAPMFEARYKSITQLIGECGATQVLELASGYSLRGLDLTQTSSLHYVETDLRDVVATKLDLLEDVRRRHNIAPRPLHAVTAADVLDLGQLQIAAAGFDRGRPLVILCEGLVGYLTREETGCLTRNVHSLLSEFTGGWWIVPDFAFKTEIQNLPPERIRLREAITGVTQRQLDASAFEDGDDLAAFLHRVGFDMQVCSQVDKTTSFSTIAALNLSPAVIERMRPVLRVWLMRLVPRIQRGEESP